MFVPLFRSGMGLALLPRGRSGTVCMSTTVSTDQCFDGQKSMFFTTCALTDGQLNRFQHAPYTAAVQVKRMPAHAIQQDGAVPSFMHNLQSNSKV